MERDFTACMQCFDQASGKTGDFIYRNSDKVTISPVFSHFGQLLNWMKENGPGCVGMGDRRRSFP